MKINMNEGAGIIASIKAMKASTKLGATLVKDGEAMKKLLAKSTSPEDALKILKNHIAACKKKIQSTKDMDEELKASFEESFLNAIYGGMASDLGVSVGKIKALLEVANGYDIHLETNRMQELAGVMLTEGGNFKSLSKKAEKSLDKLENVFNKLSDDMESYATHDEYLGYDGDVVEELNKIESSIGALRADCFNE